MSWCLTSTTRRSWCRCASCRIFFSSYLRKNWLMLDVTELNTDNLRVFWGCPWDFSGSIYIEENSEYWVFVKWIWWLILEPKWLVDYPIKSVTSFLIFLIFCFLSFNMEYLLILCKDVWRHHELYNDIVINGYIHRPHSVWDKNPSFIHLPLWLKWTFSDFVKGLIYVHFGFTTKKLQKCLYIVISGYHNVQDTESSHG